MSGSISNERMSKVTHNSPWQLLKLMQMRQHSLLQLSLVSGGWFGMYPLLDIAVEILD